MLEKSTAERAKTESTICQILQTPAFQSEPCAPLLTAWNKTKSGQGVMHQLNKKSAESMKKLGAQTAQIIATSQNTDTAFKPLLKTPEKVTGNQV